MTPLSELDEAAVALTQAAWHAGLRVGLAFGRAETSVDAPYRICDQCQGYGRRQRGDVAERECGRCHGTGVVLNDEGD